MPYVGPPVTTIMTHSRLLPTSILLGLAALVPGACSKADPSSSTADRSPVASQSPEPVPVPVPVLFPLTFPVPIEVAIADQRGAYTQSKMNLASIEHFSILGRDEITGDLGIATISNVPAIGSMIAEARAGVGVSMIGAKGHMGWNREALDLLSQGKTPTQVIAELAPAMATENLPRQLAVLGADGRSAGFIGSGVLGGEARSYFRSRPNSLAMCCQIDKDSNKIIAMLDAFEASQGFPLPERLMLALRAGWNAVGPGKTPSADTQFRQAPKVAGAASAAILVIRKNAGYDHRSDVLLDLRVDLSNDPLPRLIETYHAWCWAVLGPRLPTMLKEFDPTSDAYKLNQEWLRRARRRAKIGEE